MKVCRHDRVIVMAQGLTFLADVSSWLERGGAVTFQKGASPGPTEMSTPPVVEDLVLVDAEIDGVFSTWLTELPEHLWAASIEHVHGLEPLMLALSEKVRDLLAADVAPGSTLLDARADWSTFRDARFVVSRVELTDGEVLFQNEDVDRLEVRVSRELEAQVATAVDAEVAP